MAVMARESWTDERLDDLKGHMDEGFREVKGEIREVKAEIKSTRTELKEEIQSNRAEIGEVRRRVDVQFSSLNDRFDKLTYTLIAGLIGLVATHYLG
jgi:predicted nuclease with TOPRIM domain